MSFEDRFHQILRLAEAVELNVLVWGPGVGAGEHFAKREKLRQEIQNHFLRDAGRAGRDHILGDDQ